MTESDKTRALVGYRLEQAQEALSAAELNLTSHLERSAVNRAYYAMFYAVLALLASTQTETSRHSGAMAQFDERYVKPALFEKEYSRWLHKAFLQRQSADYGAEMPLTHDEIRELLLHARQFVNTVREHLQARSLLES